MAGVVVLALVTLAVVYFIRRQRDRSTAGFTNVLYSGADDAVHVS